MDSVRYIEELLCDAMKMWRLYAVQYRTLIIKYKILATIKRQENIRSDALASFVSKSQLREYPDIEFLRILEAESAREYLLDLSRPELEALVREMKSFVGSYLRATLESRVVDFQKQIERKDNNYSIYAIDPGACKGRGRHHGSRRVTLMTNEN